MKRIIALLVIGAAVAVVWNMFGNGGSGTTLKYRTADITRGDIAEVVTANGTLNPVQLVNVGTQVSGQISHIYVGINNQVKKGQLLAEMDDSVLQADLKQSRASLETARVAYEQAGRDLERTRMLVEKDYLPKVDLERAEQAYLSAKNSYDSAKSQVERDEVNLNYAKIHSPIDGIVISQDVTIGQTVAATYQTPNLFKIAGDLTQMQISVDFSEADISKIKTGQDVTFTVDAFPDRIFEGKVNLVNLNPNNQSGVVTYSVTVLVSNEDKLLLPGMTAYVSVTLAEAKDVLRIPAAALRFSPPPEQVSGLQRLLQPGGRVRAQRMGNDTATSNDKSIIYLLKGGQITPVEVTVGQSDGFNVSVSGDDITEGDKVITGVMTVEKS